MFVLMGTAAFYIVSIWKRKSLLPLLFAALAISAAGASYAEDIRAILLLQILMATFLVTSAVYGYDHFVDEHLRQQNLLARPYLTPIFLIIAVATILAVVLNANRVWISLAILILGVSYSIPLSRRKEFQFIKSFFGVKNLWVAFGWALLVYLGAGRFDSESLRWLAALVGIQVFIGSTIRDLDDQKEDSENQIHSLPVTLGIQRTIYFLHFLNFASGVLIYFQMLPESPVAMIWSSVVLWRFANLLLLDHVGLKPIFTQYWNLSTCGIIFACRIFEYVFV